MTALATGAHRLVMISDADGLSGHCVCNLFHRDGDTRTEIRELHAAHLDAVTEAMREEGNDAK